MMIMSPQPWHFHRELKPYENPLQLLKLYPACSGESLHIVPGQLDHDNTNQDHFNYTRLILCYRGSCYNYKFLRIAHVAFFGPKNAKRAFLKMCLLHFRKQCSWRPSSSPFFLSLASVISTTVDYQSK